LLCLVGAVLAMIGTLQVLFTARIPFGGGEQRVTITSWDFRIESSGFSGSPEGSEANVLINGAPVTVAAGVLVAAALGMLVAARRSAARFGGASRLTAVIGATFLAAVVCAVGVQELFWLDVFQPPEPPANLPRPDARGGAGSVGPGFWSLVAGAVLALVAAVVAWRSGRPDLRRVEPETPALGIPVVVRRLPDEPPPDHGGS
jgi:hypothetical protein